MVTFISLVGCSHGRIFLQVLVVILMKVLGPLGVQCLGVKEP